MFGMKVVMTFLIGLNGLNPLYGFINRTHETVLEHLIFHTNTTYSTTSFFPKQSVRKNNFVGQKLEINAFSIF